MTAELQAIVDLIALERDAITFLSQRGFKVARPKKAKASKAQPSLNAIGKPFSPLYNPNYKVKHRTTTAHLFKPYGNAMRFVKT